MPKLFITGGNRLEGDVKLQGAKNSALPILAATILVRGRTVIENCPDLSDVGAAIRILKALGCEVKKEGSVVTVDATAADRYEIPDDLMREMRSSIVFLGAILSRAGRAKLSYPGGCELGARPIDLHLSALRGLGCTIQERHGELDCNAEHGLRGRHITLAFPSVGATENIMLAAVFAEGETLIENAAREPEIGDLANFLTGCGAKVRGAGEGKIVVQGVSALHESRYTVMPDRIVAATYMAATAIAGGEMTLPAQVANYLGAVIPSFITAGCAVDLDGDRLRIRRAGPLRSMGAIKTQPYPGFPTDAQAPLMSLAAVGRGTTVFVENIFENRYKHAVELSHMGAKISVEGRVAVVEGVERLYCAPVNAMDLRGGAALICAALGAEGTTELGGIAHVERGYERLVETLCAVGADIRRG